MGSLRDGAYANATVIVRGGKIAAIRPGTSVFHSFNDNCLPAATADDGAGAIVADAVTPILLQSSDCIAVTGRGNTAAPYKFAPRLNPRDFVCSSEGITLKQPYAAPLVIPRDYVTAVRSTTPDTLTADVAADGTLSIGVSAAGLGIGKTRYNTYVRGTCGGSYPVWVDFLNGQYVVNVGKTYDPGATVAAGTVSPAGLAAPAAVYAASMIFPDLSTAISAADAVPMINDCVLNSAGGA